MGDGFVVFPEDNVVYAPCDASVEVVFPSKHAIGLKSEKGIELLIHVGLDTVSLNGEGFTTFVEVGDKVKKGQKLLEFDAEFIKSKGLQTATPVVITNMSENQKIEWTKTAVIYIILMKML